MIQIYAALLGMGLMVQGIAEFLAPGRIFRLWMKWIRHRLYFFHGLILIIGGFPLTAYRGRFSGVIFALGLIIVFTGPFILIYPEKIRKVFETMEAHEDGAVIRHLMYADAFVRVLSGGFLAAAYFM